MLSLLGLGFLIGMRHALEADHAAAVATLATKCYSVANTIKQGLIWGLGHTITLLLFGSLVFLLEIVVPETLANWLEFAVGIMLLGLGLDVLHKIKKERVHFYVHQHSNLRPHFQAHSHIGENDHKIMNPQPTHSKGFPYRALLVGFMHGMAGSAALILLTLQQAISPLGGILYIVIFGLGSMVGMAVLSTAIAIPLRYSRRSINWLHNGLRGSIGTTTIILGVMMIYTTASNLLS